MLDADSGAGLHAAERTHPGAGTLAVQDKHLFWALALHCGQTRLIETWLQEGIQLPSCDIPECIVLKTRNLRCLQLPDTLVLVVKKWLKRAVFLLATPIVLSTVLLSAEHVRGRVALNRYFKGLRVRGEDLSSKESGSASTQAKAAAQELATLEAKLTNGRIMPNSPPPRMRLTPAGNAVLCFKEESWVSDKQTNDWDQLYTDLETNAALLNEISLLLQKPSFDNGVDLSEAPNVKFTHLAPSKQAAGWFGVEAQLALHDHRSKDALQALISEVNVLKILAEDRILISDLVRIAIAAIARADTWEALQADGWSDADLSKLEEVWEEQHFITHLDAVFRGEAVFMHVTYNKMRNSNKLAADVLFWDETLLGLGESPEASGWWPGIERCFKREVLCRLWRFAWLDQQELLSLKVNQRLREIARQAAYDHSYKQVAQSAKQLEIETQGANWYDRLRYLELENTPGLVRSLLRSMQAETERSLAISAIAVKRFVVRHDAVPTTLSQLIPDYLAAVPLDPMDGQPIRFKSLSDGKFLLYSVGEDGIDSGGDSGLQPGKTNLRNWWQRKDVVWPAPASDEEVKAYRASEWKQ